jgi:hypothetical protein
MWSIIISTVVYGVVAWGAGRFLGHELGWERGKTRSLVAGLVGLVVSSLVGWGIDAAFPASAVNMGSLAGLSSQTSPVGGGLDQDAETKQLLQALDAIGAGLAQPKPAPAKP